MKVLNFFLVALISLLLISCGKDISGIYEGNLGLTTIEFKSDSAYLTSLGIKSKSDYFYKNNTIKIIRPEGTLIFEVQENGNLKNEMLGVFKKKQ